ncbi:hypothetical protein LOK49_LG06G01720 [Camellia lanceoleosa]|uniref:Uncharacterized protein n=1 Tax=Camellia lanceoleosa TaxID=1840588 RepID=A0ACC0HFH2_9ERIC|nr:hypothetical protein LOK49_LG06G01720 [Camellia lanceoleosa]
MSQLLWILTSLYGPTVRLMSQLYRLRTRESTVYLYGRLFMGQLFAFMAAPLWVNCLPLWPSLYGSTVFVRANECITYAYA